MSNLEKPRFFEIDAIGESSLGFISVAEGMKNIPFEVKRVYWTYYTPNNVIRGNHAHRALQQLIFAVAGEIKLNTEDQFGNKENFVLNDPKKGLYVPALVWRDIQFSHNAVLLCLASLEFDESDYIRAYDEFKSQTP